MGQTSPNPLVGAVIVRNGRITARGFHRGAGLPHAEIEALNGVKTRQHARGATLFVTLEPCSTHGRTPPCVEAIIRAGMARVVIGTIDPNPAHAGRAIESLQSAGIEVTAGTLENECRELNPAFNKWIVTGLPYVIAKVGMTLDARLARPAGEHRWITSEKSRRDAMQLRARSDAILIGAQTLRTDNPCLTVRGIPGARQPWRVVLTRSGDLPPASHLFTDNQRARTLVYQDQPLRSVLRHLGAKQITSVLIEGGTRVLGEAFDERLVDEVCFYIGPMLCGGPTVVIGGLGAGATLDSVRLRDVEYTKIGEDLRLRGKVIAQAPAGPSTVLPLQ